MTVTAIFNSTYSPINIVQEIHALPHLNSQLKEQDTTFDITYDSQWNSYSQSLLPLPIILGSIGLLALLIFQISVCCRACFTICKCLPKADVSQKNTEMDDDMDQSANNSATIPNVRYLYIAFFIFAALALCANQSIIFGSNDLVRGVSTSNDAIDYVQDMFDGLVSYGDTLYIDGQALDALFAEAVATNCSAASQLQDELPAYFEYVEEYQGYVNPVPDKCSTASDLLDEYGTEYKNSSAWTLYGTVVLSLGLYLIGLFCKSKLTLQLSVQFVQLLMFVLFILCAVEMVILMGLADFCMEPTLYVQSVVPPSVQNITSYYATCVGTNPLGSSLTAAQALVDSGEAAVQTLLQTPQCANNTALQQALGVMGSIDGVFGNITAATACPPTQAQLNSVLNTGLCEQSFRGVYLVWIGQLSSSACLFVATVLVSLLYQYFNPHWDVDQQSSRHTGGSMHNSAGGFGDSHHSNADNGGVASSSSPNEYYYSTSTMHTGSNSTQNNMVTTTTAATADSPPPPGNDML